MNNQGHDVRLIPAPFVETIVAYRWAESEDVGVYADGLAALLVEKDFACLDGNDPEDADAFPNPQAGLVC